MSLEIDTLFRLIKGRYKSPAKIALYENYLNRLVARGVPPILSFRHLADLLELPAATLHGIAFKTHLYYKSFSIPKRSGGYRQIVAPNLLLDSIQRWIGKEILAVGFVDFSENVVGYVANRSIKDHVEPHASSECLIKFDLKDFFPSIPVEFVCKVFLELGYAHSVARTLAALVTHQYCLPQGASTSPFISNLYMRSFDSSFSEYCRSNDYVYTRYADDIVVSGGKELLDNIKTLKILFINHGLMLNHSKTRVYKEYSKIRFITGLILNKGQVRVPKAMRRRIRVQCHIFLGKIDQVILDGPPMQVTEVPESWNDKEYVFDPLFPERLLGKLSYWMYIEPQNPFPRMMQTAIKKKLSSI